MDTVGLHDARISHPCMPWDRHLWMYVPTMESEGSHGAWIRGMGHIIGVLHSDVVERDDVAQQHEYSYQHSG